MKRLIAIPLGIAVVGILGTVAIAVPRPGPAGESAICDGHGPRGARAQHGAMGQRGGMRGEAGQGHMIMRRIMALDLSTEQATQLRTIKHDTQKQIIPKKAELDVKRLELREIMGQPEVNRRALNSKIDEMGALRTEIQHIKMNAMLGSRGLLTSEQLTKFLDPTWRPHRRDVPDDGGSRRGMRRGG